MTSVPATVLTGFLGSGKTTLLKRILTEHHGDRIAVIENEFGEVNVDAEILVADAGENIIQLSNGCVCCKIREDLRSTLRELSQARGSGRLRFDRLVIETTGVADPGPIAHTFFADERIAEAYTLDAIVTLVDACHAQSQLDQWQEARRQVGFADRLFISKSELAAPAAVDALRRRLRNMNPRAPQRTVHFGDVELADVFDLQGFRLTSRLDIDPQFPSKAAGHDHQTDQCEHDAQDSPISNDDVATFVYCSDRPFLPARLERFLGKLADEQGPRLLRYKGVMHLLGMRRKVILQGVHQLMNSDEGPRWAEGEERQSRIVFIGIDLPEALIRSGLDACLT
jgi:G3E family GTPase